MCLHPTTGGSWDSKLKFHFQNMCFPRDHEEITDRDQSSFKFLILISVYFHETWDSSNVNFGLRSTFVVSKPLMAATKHYVPFHLQELHYISWKGLICMQGSFITAFTHYPKDSQLSSLLRSNAHLFTRHCSIIYPLTRHIHYSYKGDRHWDFSPLHN